MRHQDLKNGEVYGNILDMAIPLRFIGKKTVKNNFGHLSTIVHFTPVRTERNKNWYNSMKIHTKNFDNKTGNRFIKKLQQCKKT